MSPRLPHLLTLTISATLTAQTSWTLLAPSNAPPAYTAHASAYFLVTNTTVLFGGIANGVRSSDTWIWDGNDWTQASPVTVPPARVAHTMVYDFNRSKLVMFGGISATGSLLDDTWEWDGNDWTLMTPATSKPSARRSHCMVFYPSRGTSVLFGGYATGDLNDLWEWDGNDWAPIPTANSPAPRRASDMAWSPVNDGIVLFSGYFQTADTWLFDGVDWLALTPATVPPARYDHSMITDRSRDRVVMFGAPGTGDTWEWDGTDWLDRSAGNTIAAHPDTYLAYDWVLEEVTMFGSAPTSETWRYAPVRPATFSIQGNLGCPGTSGLPPTLLSGTRPWLNETYSINIAQLPNNGIGLMLSGLSDTQSALGPLPASLAAIGMPGCLLQVDPLLIDAVLATGTNATWQLNIPNSPALLAQQFFSQCAAIDIGANAANLTVGNYSAAVIGGK
jgi:hypothetical protein